MKRSGGGTVSLLLKGHVSRTFSRLGLIETSESITADYNILVNLSNCLHTILHEFDILIPYAGSDTWLEDAQGIIRIGSWQYHKIDPGEIGHNVDKGLQEKLEMCKWVKPPHATDDAKHVPRWLSVARGRAMDAHGEVKALRELVAAQDPRHINATIEMCKDKLVDGHMTGAEFKLFLEKELQYGQSMRPEAALDDHVKGEQERKFLGLNVPLNMIRFAHKIKGVVKKNNKLGHGPGMHSTDYDEGEGEGDGRPISIDSLKSSLKLQQKEEQERGKAAQQDGDEEEEEDEEKSEASVSRKPSFRPLQVERMVFLDDASSASSGSDDDDDVNEDTTSAEGGKARGNHRHRVVDSSDEDGEKGSSDSFPSSDIGDDSEDVRSVSIHKNIHQGSSFSRSGLDNER